MSKLIALPPNSLANSNKDVAAFLRSYADKIEAGELGSVESALLSIENETTLNTVVVGNTQLSEFKVIALLGVAHHQYIQRALARE